MATAVAADAVAQLYSEDRDEWAARDCSRELCLTVVVLGATGDLAAKKTFPALATLFSRGLVPPSLTILGYGRSDYSDAQLRDKIKGKLPQDVDVDTFLSKVTYQRGQYDEPEGFREVTKKLAEKEGNYGGGVGRLFYLAVPPSIYGNVAAMVAQECADVKSEADSSERPSWVRIVIEKPFGKDYDSSEELGRHIAKHFSEEAVYRIDHYLGRELTQNLLIMRFSNPFLSAVWNRASIDNIQIVMKESFGTQGRGGYYNDFGVIRDVVQNHLLQVLALLTMERPVSMHPDDIRDEKTKLMRAIKTVRTEDVVLGQYTAGAREPGYTDDDGVPNDSQTATYAAMHLRIDNERWEGVPLLIKAGKALSETKMEARVQFKTQPGFFGANPEGMRNEFVIQLKPKDAMYFKMVVKAPGLELEPIVAELDLTYNERFDAWIAEPYERLILDAIRGNQQHFVRRDELRAAWAVFTPLLHAIDGGKGPEVHKYEFGSRGVEAGDLLVEQAGYVRSSDYHWKAKM